MDAVLVAVEGDVSSRSLPSFQVVGLGDKAVDESKERVRSAIKNSGLDFPKHKITVNLAPADLPKEGSVYDLPIAVGLLLANESLAADMGDSLFIGELSLDGSLHSTPGVLPLALMAKELGIKRIFLPKINAPEAAVVSNIAVYGVSTLKELVDHFLQIVLISRQVKEDLVFDQENFEFDFIEIKGQELAKRALEIAAAGCHNVLLKGAPGSGKTLLARTFPSILPRLTEQEAIEVSRIYSVTGQLPSGKSLITTRPFRSPHHTTSYVGLIGGGAHPKPGEISMSHRGVLFLDELPEFRRDVLEALRQPLEDGFVTVSRALGTSTFPAKFTLIGACNPCPCGYYGDLKRKCLCTFLQIRNYEKKLSGPLMDRIDLHVPCPSIPAEKLTLIQSGEKSQIIRERVQKARDRQLNRYSGRQINSNAELSNKEIREFCKINDQTIELLKKAATNLNITGRGFSRILKVARTIADLADQDEIALEHVMEAIQYRFKDS